MTTTIKRPQAPQAPQVSSTAPTQAVEATKQQKLELLKELRYLEPGADGPETRQSIEKLQDLLVKGNALQEGQFEKGVYDDTTQRGVMAWQQEVQKRGNKDMVIDGKVGQQTWGTFMGLKLPPGKDLLKEGGAPEPAAPEKQEKGWQAGNDPKTTAPATPAPATPAPATPAPATPAPATTTTAPATAGPTAPAAPGAPKGPTDTDLAQAAADAQLTAGVLSGSTFNVATAAANQLHRAERVGAHYDRKATKMDAAAERATARAATAPNEAARNKFLEQAKKSEAKAEKFRLNAEKSRTRDFFGLRKEPAAGPTEPVKAGTAEPVKAGTTEPVKAPTTGTSGTAPTEPAAEPTIRARADELAKLEGDVTTKSAALRTAQENASMRTGNVSDLETKAQTAEKAWAQERNTVSDTARKAGDQKINEAWAKANEAKAKATTAQNAVAEAEKQLVEAKSKVEGIQKANQATVERVIKSGAPTEPAPTVATTKAPTAAPTKAPTAAPVAAAEEVAGTATKGFMRNLASGTVEKFGVLAEKAGPALKTTAAVATKVGEVGLKAAGIATRLVTSALPALNLVGTGLAAIEANNHAAAVEADPKASDTKKALAKWAARTANVAVGGAGVSVLPVPVLAQVIGGVTSFGGTVATLGLQAVEYFQ